MKPQNADSPKRYWRLHGVLHDSGAGGWSAAEGQWEDDGVWNKVLAIRWNGSSHAEIGNPQSRGCATWFIVPDELENAIRAAIASLPTRTGATVS